MCKGKVGLNRIRIMRKQKAYTNVWVLDGWTFHGARDLLGTTSYTCTVMYFGIPPENAMVYPCEGKITQGCIPADLRGFTHVLV